MSSPTERLTFGFAFVLLACSGQTTINEIFYVIGDAGALTASGGAGGVSAGAAGASGVSGSGGGAGQTGLGGTADASGDAGIEGDADSGLLACTIASDCPLPASVCQVVSCNQGVCETNVASISGAHIEDVPADCHATVSCDGQGHPMLAVDQNNVPTPPNPCLIGTCNSVGTAGTEPGPAGTPCAGPVGARLCDGAGSCVECLHSSDCRADQVCSATWRCMPVSSCTDVDCGGTCPPCADGKKCLSDQDCTSAACDAVSKTCNATECTDHRQDGLETDADCGGGICPLCALGKSCLLSSDCATRACDALTSRCVSNQCADHRQDGFETDIDCGGSGGCSACNAGQACKTNFDCVSGHFCNGIHVCQ